MPKANRPLTLPAYISIPDLGPRVLAIDLRQVVKGQVVLLLRRVAVQRFQKRHHELRRVRPVVERIPLGWLRRRRRRAFQIRRQIGIGRLRHLQIAREDVEDAAHVGRALNVRVAAQRVDAAARSPDVAEQQLQHRRRANDLRAERVLRPADGVDDRRRLLHVAVFADGREQIGGFEELILRNAGDPLDHLRRVARVLLLQQLKDRARVLQAKDRRRRWAAASAAAFVRPAPKRRAHRLPDVLRLPPLFSDFFPPDVPDEAFLSTLRL